MKRTLAALVLALALAAQVYAAGTVAMTEADPVNGVVKYTITWTCDASGNVNGNALRIKSGKVIQSQFVPGTGGTAPWSR
jgi:hypothetical protein